MNIVIGCLFDLDGVLVDTARFHYLAWKRLAENIGFNFTEEQNEQLKGISRMESLNILLNIGGINVNTSKKEEYAALKNSWYVEYIRTMDSADILPGVCAFLDDLKKNGCKMALGSASKNAPLILERTGLEKWFDAVVDGNSISRAKPDPEVFLTGAERLGIDPRQCVVFEDAAAGIAAARNGGMFSVGVGDPRQLLDADIVVRGFKKLTYDELKKQYMRRRPE